MAGNAEIQGALDVVEGAALLARCRGWSEWLRPWLEGQIRMREARIAEWIRSGDLKELQKAQIEIDTLRQIAEKPANDAAVCSRMLKLQAGGLGGREG